MCVNIGLEGLRQLSFPPLQKTLLRTGIKTSFSNLAQDKSFKPLQLYGAAITNKKLERDIKG